MATELIDIELDEISLVDKGDDPEARIALFKRGKTKSVDGRDLPASAFAYVPEPDKPSTWKLPIHDAKHVGMAAAALGGGFRGKKVQIPQADRAKVKGRVRTAWRRLHAKGDEMPPALKRGFVETLRDVLKGEGDAQSFDDVLDENAARRQVMESMDKLWEMVNALQGSVESIMSDDEVTDKRAAVQESLNQFSEALRGAMPAAKSIAPEHNPGDVDMSDEALKQKIEELEKRLDEETVARKAAEEELEKLRAEGDGDDMNKDLPEDVRKRIEAQDEEIAKLREREEDREARAHLDEVAKSVPGVTAEAFVKGYRALDDKGREALDVVLKSAAEAHAQLQKEVGKDGEGSSGSALDRATEEARKLMVDKPSEFTTMAKARAHVWRMHPELKAEYTAERARAN